MFCFLADVEIHRRTGNRLGLQDAMRAVVKASGGLTADWPIDRVFATADEATGTKVFEELYAQMKDSLSRQTCTTVGKARCCVGWRGDYVSRRCAAFGRPQVDHATSANKT